MSGNATALTGRLDRQLYNQKEFKQADRLERIRMHLIAGARGNYQLTDPEEEYLGYMEQAWSVLLSQRSRIEAVKLLRCKIEGLRRFSALQILRDAEAVFGDFVEVHRITQRGMIRENLLKRIAKCEEKIDGKASYDEAGVSDEKVIVAWEKQLAGYWKLLMELDQITTIEDAVKADTTLPELDFTTDPAALMETEEADYTVE